MLHPYTSAILIYFILYLFFLSLLCFAVHLKILKGFRYLVYDSVNLRKMDCICICRWRFLSGLWKKYLRLYWKIQGILWDYWNFKICSQNSWILDCTPLKLYSQTTKKLACRKFHLLLQRRITLPLLFLLTCAYFHSIGQVDLMSCKVQLILYK